MHEAMILIRIYAFQISYHIISSKKWLLNIYRPGVLGCTPIQNTKLQINLYFFPRKSCDVFSKRSVNLHERESVIPRQHPPFLHSFGAHAVQLAD